jgi:hypothetical protein
MDMNGPGAHSTIANGERYVSEKMVVCKKFKTDRKVREVRLNFGTVVFKQFKYHHHHLYASPSVKDLVL